MLKRKLRETLGIIDNTHICCLFLNKNDRKLKYQLDIYSKKLFDLGFENFQTSHDPDKVIFNYSSHVLTESGKSLLCKGLNFAIPPKTLKYADYLLPFELLYRAIHNLDITNEKKEVLKPRIKDCTFSSFNSYNENDEPLNLTPEELAALKSLSKNQNVVIQKSDRDKSIAIIDKNKYLKKMRNILSDCSKFTKVSIAEDKQLNFIDHVEKDVTDLLKDLKKSEGTSETVYKILKPRGSRSGILYGLCKVHKQLVDNCPPFRPIMSAIKTPTYNLAKFLVPLLESITTNMHIVKNSFEFAKEIADKEPELFMTSLDVESLFVPLCDSLFSNNAKVNNINRTDFEKLLRAALQNNFFNFERKIYKQIDGVAMGSHLGLTLANAFLCLHEQIWLNECPDKFKPVYYRRYVDSIFALFRSPDHLEKFKNYSNSKHRNMRFTCEKEHNNSIPFIDVLITRTSNGFKTSVYRKLIFSGVYSNFNSFIFEEYKVGFIFTLLFRTFSIVSDFSRFHSEVCYLKRTHFLSN